MTQHDFSSGPVGHHGGQKGFFDVVSSKTAFMLGAVTSLLVVCSVGFFVLLGMGFGSGVAATANEGQQLAVAPTPSPAAPAAQPAADLLPVSGDDHIRGNKDAKITIVEYSDYECPFCSRFHETMKQVMAAFPNDVRWVYRHFPLDQLHPNARAAAEASECVAELGGNDKFWEFSDRVFAGGTPATADKLRGYAQAIGVNVAKYDECVAAGKYRLNVQEEQGAGAAAGVQGTPGNFLIEPSGAISEIPGAQPFEVIEPVIKGILAS